LAFWISLAETCNNNLLANFSQKQDRKSAWEPDGKDLKSRDYPGRDSVLDGVVALRFNKNSNQ
jgi:hypothetical protein